MEEINKLNLGAILKQARENQGYTIAEVVIATKIRYSHIQAIENNEYEKLPERTYTLGYISRYSNFLGLNTKEILSQAKEEYKLKNPVYNNMVQNNRLDKKYNPINVIKENIIDFIFIIFSFGFKRYNSAEKKFNKHNTSSKKKLLIFCIITLVIISIFLGVFVFKKNGQIILNEEPIAINSKIANELDFQTLHKDITKDTPNTKILNKDDLIIVNKNSSSIEDSDGEKESFDTRNDLAVTSTRELASANKIKITSWPKTNLSSNISLRFNKNVWVRIYNKNTQDIYLDTIFKSGDKFSVPNLPDLAMNVGDYKGMYLVVNNRLIYLTSTSSSNVLKKINLDVNDLLKTYLIR